AVGLTGLSFAGLVTGSSMSFSSTGAGAAGTKEAVEVTYSVGDFSTHVSTNGTDTEGFAAYSMNGWTVAAALSDTDTAANTESALTVSGKLGGVTLGFGTAKTKGGDQQSTVSGKFSVGAATTVNAYYNDNEANTIDDKSYGIGFAHDLGGATLKGGVEKTNDQTFADFGVVFNF
ncbi:porin, partial [Lentibacter sp.]|uniref:porin n=1 Tax=Lentibacter sp. TaxID=2024994 RepID=UPI003F6A9189